MTYLMNKQYYLREHLFIYIMTRALQDLAFSEYLFLVVLMSPVWWGLHDTLVPLDSTYGSPGPQKWYNKIKMFIILLSYLPRRGLRGIVFILSVCVCMYLCVRPIFWYFISRLLEEISILNVYMIIIGLYWIHWKKWPSCVKGQGHRDGTLFFKGSRITKTEP